MIVPIVSVFGEELFKYLAVAGPAGAFISPLSIYIALALALNGATHNSTTFNQLWDPLANSISPAPFSNLSDLNSYTKGLIRTLAREAQRAQGTELVISNAIFTNRTAVATQYANVAISTFNAPVLQAANATRINKWIEKKTNNMIKQAVPDDMKFKLMMVNAIYFFGSWVLPFNKTLTSTVPFTTPAGKQINVKMMHSNFFGVDLDSQPRLPQIHIEKGRYQAVKLPYRSSNLSAIAVLCDVGYKPNAAACLSNLFKDTPGLLNGTGWRNITDYDSIHLPRFEVEVKQLSLVTALKHFGVVAPFTDEAEFGKLSHVSLKIDEIFHSTIVKVDEEGTEAAAVTSVVLGPTAVLGDTIIFNRPFVFMVVDEVQQTALFLGIVNQPTQA